MQGLGNRLRRSSHWLLAASTLSLASVSAARAGILALQCSGQTTTHNAIRFTITIYDDGTPARIGTDMGIGDKARVWMDEPTGAIVLMEINTDGIPITLTTINKDGRFVHSRHVLAIPHGVQVTEQHQGNCVKRQI